MRGFIVLLLLLLTACDISISGKEVSLDKVVRVNIGGVELDIPQAYVLPDLPPSMVPRTADMDTDSGSILIRVPLAHLGMDAESEKWPNTLSSRIYAASLVNEPVSQHMIEAWKARGSHKERVVEFDEEVQLWRVYMAPTRRWIWLYFDKHPEEIKSKPNEAFIASCSVSSREDEILYKARCRSDINYKTSISEISFSGKYFLEREKIYQAYIKMLEVWDKAVVN